MPARGRDIRAELDVYRTKYRHVFPAYTFFLHGIEPAEHARLSQRIAAHGARVEPCFSAQCTHLVTPTAPVTKPDKPALAHVDPNRRAPWEADTTAAEKTGLQDSDSTDDLVAQAARMNMRIWGRAKLLKILNVFDGAHDPGLDMPAAEAGASADLRTLLAADKMAIASRLPAPQAPSRAEYGYGTPQAQANGYEYVWDPTSGQYVLTGLYAPLDPGYATLLVEDATQTCRPVYLEMFAYPQEGELAPWSVLYNDGEGRCPFAAPSARRKQEPTPNAWRSLRVVLNQAEAVAWGKDQLGAWTEGEGNTSEGFMPGGMVANASPRTPTGSVATPPSAWPGSPGMDVGASAASGVAGLSSVRTTSTRVDTDTSVWPKGGPIDPRLKALHQRPTFAPPSPPSAPYAPRSAVRDFMALRATGSLMGTSRRRSKDKKPGYCENCRTKFDDLEEHALSRRHVRFARNEENFVEIDALIDSVARQVLHPIQPAH